MSSAISIRPTDSDDVKWALHTASTQVDRGSLADAIQWVKRAAQYAEDSGDAWRATELKNSARVLAEQMWTSEPDPAEGEGVPPSSSMAIEVSVEDVEADDLLDGAASASGAPTQHPGAYQPGLYSGGFQSVPPGVVLRQSYPADSAPPEPIPLYRGGGAPHQAMPPAHNAAPGAWSPQQPPAGSSGGFVTKAPTLQFGTPQASEAAGQRPPPPRRRSIRPKAPGRISSNPPPPHRSSSPADAPPGGPEVFSSAPPADRFSARLDQRSQLGTPRGPLGSAPELLVSEIDLEGAAFATSSLLPPAPSSAEPELTPEEFERDLQSQDNDYVVSSTPFEVDPSLANLFAPEEVVDDRDSVDRMSDVMLDPSEFEHQSLVDDQEETHVLTKNVVQSLKDASRHPPPPKANESGEHEALSQSAFPTAPPPGAATRTGSAAYHPPPASRPPSADMRRVVQPASTPPVPFQPAPSSPLASLRAPAPPSSAPPSSTASAFASVPPSSSAPPLSAPPFSTAPPVPSMPPVSTTPPSSPAGPKSAPPLLVRRSSRAADLAPGRLSDASGPTSTAPTVQPHPPAAPPLSLGSPGSLGSPQSQGAALSLGEPISLGAPGAMSVSGPASLDALSLTSLPPSYAAPSLKRPSSVAPGAAPAVATPPLLDPFVDGVNLAEARGFEDLPEEVQLALASSARVERLSAGEEVSFFGAAIVTSGRVDILPAFSEEAGAVADEGDVIFTHGNLEGSIDLRVVAKLDDTRVGVWDPETLRNAIAECPWVADELKLIADRYLALCGATLGPLGERLDDSLRATVFQRLEVRVFNEGDVLVELDKPIPGLLIIGGGRVLIRDAAGERIGRAQHGRLRVRQRLARWRQGTGHCLRSERRRARAYRSASGRTRADDECSTARRGTCGLSNSLGLIPC